MYGGKVNAPPEMDTGTPAPWSNYGTTLLINPFTQGEDQLYLYFHDTLYSVILARFWRNFVEYLTLW